MTKGKKRLLWIGGTVAVLGVLGTLAYIQYKKFMKYCMKPSSAKINRISLNSLNFDIFFKFFNTSDVNFTLLGQKYKVYMNGVYITTLSNAAQNEVPKKTESEIGLNVELNPKQVAKDIGLNVFEFIKDWKNINVKIDMKMRVKVFGLTVNVPYVYEDTLGAMVLPAPENKSQEQPESEC